MNKQKVRQKVALYRTIAEMVQAQEFDPSYAEYAIGLYAAVKDEASITDVTVGLLRELHEANWSDNGDFDLLLWLVGNAFSDLAKHLKWPAARKTFEDLRELIDADKEDLFLRIVNVKYLAHNPDGCTVVTMVVDNHRKFREFLLNKDTVATVRFSDDATIAL